MFHLFQRYERRKRPAPRSVMAPSLGRKGSGFKGHNSESIPVPILSEFWACLAPLGQKDQPELTPVMWKQLLVWLSRSQPTSECNMQVSSLGVDHFQNSGSP